MTAPRPPERPVPDATLPFRVRMETGARVLRAAAEAAWLPAVRAQLMRRVEEFENASLSD